MSSVTASTEGKAVDQPYRVMLVDDSAVIRGLFRRTLEADPEITIVSSVSNGQLAIDALERRPVDVVVLDIEMPVMNGMAALPRILKVDPDVKVIMASTLTQENAAISMKALADGATDYIPKPTARHEIHSAEAFKRELVEKVKALGFARRSKGRPPGAPRIKVPQPDGSQPEPAAPRRAVPEIKLRTPSTVRPAILCIGSSTGGPPALMQLLAKLKDGFDLPILITQHMPKTFTAILAQQLQKVMERPCAEAIDGELIRNGGVYVAPGELHMVVEKGAAGNVLRLDDGPQENYCKPAVDPLLRSVAEVFGNQALVAILTGMGHDGLAGARNVVSAGGTLIAQDEATSVVWGMPGAVATAGICSAIIPLPDLAAQIRKIAGKPAS